MNLLERLRRWWAPGEYDDENRRPSDGEGHALTETERTEQAEPEFRIGRRSTSEIDRG